MGLTRITSDGITDATIATADIADGSVTLTKLAANSVGSDKIPTAAVTSDKIAAEAVDLTKLPHGTSSNDGKFLRANNGADPTFEVVNTDLVADTSPQLGGDLDTNSFEINLDDSHAVNFGDSQDAEIKHTGANFVIRNTEGNIRIEPKNGELGIQIAPDDGVSLYFDNSKKFETTNAGATLTGSLTVTNDIHLEDNLLMGDTDKIRLGNSQDFEIFFDGSNSFITDGGGSTGLVIQAPLLAVKNAAGSENMIVAVENGSVELNYDNSKKLSTRSDGIEIHAPEGGEAGLYLTADEGDDTNDKYRLIAQNSGDLVFQRHTGSAYSSELRLKSAGGIQANFQGSNKFETTTNGIKVNDRFEIRNGVIFDNTANGNNCGISFNGDGIRPTNGSGTETDNTYDLGQASFRWRNIYTADLQLSNKGSSNDVDGTWGSYTIQEGESDLFLINKRNGKKYKFNLTEVN